MVIISGQFARAERAEFAAESATGGVDSREQETSRAKQRTDFVKIEKRAFNYVSSKFNSSLGPISKLDRHKPPIK
jgi:hypothetical protein